MQQTLRITSFRGPTPDHEPETKTLSTALLVRPAPPSGSIADVADEGLFASSKRGCLDARRLCHPSLALAADDMTGIIQSATCRSGDAWASADQASRLPLSSDAAGFLYFFLSPHCLTPSLRLLPNPTTSSPHPSVPALHSPYTLPAKSSFLS